MLDGLTETVDTTSATTANRFAATFAEKLLKFAAFDPTNRETSHDMQKTAHRGMSDMVLALQADPALRDITIQLNAGSDDEGYNNFSIRFRMNDGTFTVVPILTVLPLEDDGRNAASRMIDAMAAADNDTTSAISAWITDGPGGDRYGLIMENGWLGITTPMRFVQSTCEDIGFANWMMLERNPASLNDSANMSWLLGKTDHEMFDYET